MVFHAFAQWRCSSDHLVKPCHQVSQGSLSFPAMFRRNLAAYLHHVQFQIIMPLTGELLHRKTVPGSTLNVHQPQREYLTSATAVG